MLPHQPLPLDDAMHTRRSSTGDKVIFRIGESSTYYKQPRQKSKTPPPMKKSQTEEWLRAAPAPVAWSPIFAPTEGSSDNHPFLHGPPPHISERGELIIARPGKDIPLEDIHAHTLDALGREDGTVVLRSHS